MTRNQFIIVFIIVVAAVFRFWNLGERTLFSGEATMELNAIEKLISGETSRLVGLYAATYVPGELHTTPWFLYLMAPVFLAFRGDPRAFIVLHPLLGVIGIAVLYRAVTILVSRKTAIIAATLYATWMTIVNLDRSVWSLGLIPTTVNLVMFTAAKAWTAQRKTWWIALGTILGFSISLHLQMLAITGLTLTLVFIIARRFFVWTLLPVVLSFLPLALFDLTHHFQTVAAFPKTIVSLFDGTRPYSASYFIYQFFPFLIIGTSAVLSRIHRNVAILIIGGFLMLQLQAFITYSAHPNFVERRALSHNLLEYWTPEDGLTVFINDRSYFEYGYLLLYYGRDQGVRSDNVTKLEHPKPTQQLIEKVRAKAREIESKDVAFAQVKNKESLLLLDEDRLKLLPLSAFQFDITDTRTKTPTLPLVEQ